jgi:hypothetical protein
MALIADDLAFFGDHGVAALGTGIKKFLGFVDDRIVFDPTAKIKQRWQGCDDGLGRGFFIVHKTSLTRRFKRLNPDLFALFVLD